MQKKKNYYTIMFIPEGNVKPFSMHIHRSIVYSLCAFLVIFLISFFLLVVKSGEIAAKLQLVYLLSNENRQLKEENKTMKAISEKLDNVEQLSRYLQRVATVTNADTKKGMIAFSSKVTSGDETVFAKDNMDEMIDNLRNTSENNVNGDQKKQETSENLSASIPNIQPVVDGWVTRHYTTVSNDTLQIHNGIDYAAANGTLIRSTAPGIVQNIANDKYFGLILSIKHGNGFLTKYGHCSQILVAVGDHVERGQTIALVGNTGRSSAPHLHYEVLKDGSNVDPTKYIYGGFDK